MRGKGRGKEKGKTSDKRLRRIPFRGVLPVEIVKEAVDFHQPILESPRKKVNIIAGVASIFHSVTQDIIGAQGVILPASRRIRIYQYRL